jgi:hypothetical protein
MIEFFIYYTDLMRSSRFMLDDFGVPLIIIGIKWD